MNFSPTTHFRISNPNRQAHRKKKKDKLAPGYALSAANDPENPNEVIIEYIMFGQPKVHHFYFSVMLILVHITIQRYVLVYNTRLTAWNPYLVIHGSKYTLDRLISPPTFLYAFINKNAAMAGADFLFWTIGIPDYKENHFTRPKMLYRIFKCWYCIYQIYCLFLMVWAYCSAF